MSTSMGVAVTILAAGTAVALAADKEAEPVSPTQVLEIRVDPAKGAHPISPLVYGINDLYERSEFPGRRPVCTMVRLGGNRMTAYNWENNASNAGVDWHHQNDDFMSKSTRPGEAVRRILDYTFAQHIPALITIPTIGHVAADRNGDGDVLNSGPAYLGKRFKASVPAKGAPFTLTPDASDDRVFQDEFVNWVKTQYPEGFSDPSRAIYFALDNEPDLWASTHARLRGVQTPEGRKTPHEVEKAAKPTYAEMVRNNIAYAAAIKNVAPEAKVLGPDVWSWVGLHDLSGAKDANGRNFTEFYLAQMAQAEKVHHRRLVDYFDFHHYSGAEAVVNGKKIGVTSQDTSPEVVAARVQAPRSFWDPAYVENSWYVGVNGGKPLRIIPELRERIARTYPGTGIAITEYNVGGQQHISGGLAQADFLGILGREGVGIATWWNLGPKASFVLGAFDLYLNFDRKGARFGDTSVSASTSNLDAASVYASTDSTHSGRLTIVVINKTDQPQTARIELVTGRVYSEAQVYRLEGNSPVPAEAGAVASRDGRLEYAMPAYSASVLCLVPSPTR